MNRKFIRLFKMTIFFVIVTLKGKILNNLILHTDLNFEKCFLISNCLGRTLVLESGNFKT